MIRRINKLKNVGRFANLRSQRGNQGDFEKFNVITVATHQAKAPYAICSAH